MASAFIITKEQGRKLESMAYAAKDEAVRLGAQDEDGTITLAFLPGYRQPDTDRILDHPLPVAPNGFHYRTLESDGTVRPIRGGRGPRP